MTALRFATALTLAACTVWAAPALAQEEQPHTPEWFYLTTDAGYESINLQTFNASNDALTAELIPSTGGGPTVSVGLGFRLVFLTLGARTRMAAFHDANLERNVGSWQSWSFDGEVGFIAPLGRWEPRLLFDVGYMTFGGFRQALSGLGRGIDVNGVDLRATAGFDYFVTDVFSVGLSLGGGVLLLARPGVSVRDLAASKEVSTINEAKARILEGNGSSVGTVLSLTAAAGLHF